MFNKMLMSVVCIIGLQGAVSAVDKERKYSNEFTPSAFYKKELLSILNELNIFPRLVNRLVRDYVPALYAWRTTIKSSRDDWHTPKACFVSYEDRERLAVEASVLNRCAKQGQVPINMWDLENLIKLKRIAPRAFKDNNTICQLPGTDHIFFYTLCNCDCEIYFGKG